MTLVNFAHILKIYSGTYPNKQTHPMLNIEEPKTGLAAFWSKAFRVFFTAAASYAVINMLIWLLTFAQAWHIASGGISSFQWHAHELIWGYGAAVLAGFLLTAVGNWTGRATASAGMLQAMFATWLLGRIGWLAGGNLLWLGAIGDGLFLLLFFGQFVHPVMASKQWRQGGIVAKLIMLLVGHLMISASALKLVAEGHFWAETGVFIGLFAIIGLLLTFLRRVYPFFVRAASGGTVQLPTPLWIDRASMVLFVMLFVIYLGWWESLAMPLVSGALGLVLLIRLWAWNDATIWRAPLLWSLYLGLAMITLGALLLAASYWLPQWRFVAIHTWSMGGFGLVTLGMMLRVGLGHTGRNVRQPRVWLWLALVPMLVAVLLRLLTPLLAPTMLPTGYLLSQLSWSLAFGVMLVCLVPVFFKPNQQGL